MGKRRIILLVGVVAALIVAALGLVSAARRVAAFQPLGFGASRSGGAWLVNRVAEPATGLVVGDLVVLVAGAQPIDIRDLNDRLRSEPTSQLLVLRNDAPVEVHYTRPPLDVDFAYLALIFGGTVALAVGLFTLGRAPHEPAARLFFGWSLASAAVHLISHPPGVAFDTVARVAFLLEELARLFVAPLAIHLFTIFPRDVSAPRPRRLAWLYVPATALALIQVALVFGLGPNLGRSGLTRLDHIALFHLVAGTLAAAAVLAVRSRKLVGSEPRRQAVWIALGLTCGYLPFLFVEVLPLAAGLVVPQLWRTLVVVPLVLVPFSFAWAILRYRLWDLGIVLRDGVAAAVTLTLGGTTFALLQLAIDRHLPLALSDARPLVSAVAGLFTAGLLVPTQRTVRRRFERTIHTGRWEQRRALTEIGRTLLAEHDPVQLEWRLLQALADGIGLDDLELLHLEGERLRDREGRFDVAADFVEWSRATLPIGPGSIDSSAELALFEAGLRYAFPLVARDKRLGLLCLGYRNGEQPLSSEDLDLVGGVAGQASLALENARLVDALGARLAEVVALERRTEGIIASSPAGIALVDADGVVRKANVALVTLLGADPTGQDLAVALPVELPADGSGPARRCFVDGRGVRRHLEVARSRSTLDGKDLSILVVQDVGDRVAMEEELREKDRLAALGMLAAGVAHEVNTPLTGISSYAQMLLAKTPAGDDRHELLRKVERQTFRASRIVNDLLDFARDRGAGSGAVPLDKVLTECLDLLAHRFEEQGVVLASTVTPQPLPAVRATQADLEQVLTNLLVNALDAMPNGGRLEVHLEAADHHVVATVGDTGSGIAANDLERIFRPFYSTKLGRGGTGLGLAITYQLVRRHGGELTVTSSPGVGSTFTVTLPQHLPSPSSST